tara:strand:+ start:233 stop:1498 length:1266 start_codon:yes stop_codon:yes gene_type:complete
MAYGSTQPNNYAGPVNPGDMVVQPGTAPAGVSALLNKRLRNGAGGIFQIPNPNDNVSKDFYNNALTNVQNQIKSQADTINAMAPEGEQLAYINEQEAGILKLLGGAGEPVNATGIPSFFSGTGGGVDKDKEKSKNKTNENKRDRISQSLKDAMDNRKSTGSVYTKPDRKDAREYAPMVAGGIGAAEFEDDKDISDNYAQQAIINSYLAGSAAQMGGEDYTIGDDAIRGLNALRGQANNTLFSSDYSKMFNQGMKYGDPLSPDSIGNFNLGSDDNDISTDDAKKLRYALGGSSSDIGNFLETMADNSILAKLLGFLPGDSFDDRSFNQRTKGYDNMQAQRARQDFLSSREGPKTTTSTTEESGEEEDDGDDDTYDYFGYRRKFQAPMTFKDLIARAYSSDPDRLNMLEDLGDAVKRRDEENA